MGCPISKTIEHMKLVNTGKYLKFRFSQMVFSLNIHVQFMPERPIYKAFTKIGDKEQSLPFSFICVHYLSLYGQ